MSARTFARLLSDVRACEICASSLPAGPRPVLQAHPDARILIAGQAPGRRVHESGVSFDDPSGVRLREWLGLDREAFYDPALVAILPMGFCYPGTGKSGDLPPRPECAPAWREELLHHLVNVELTLVLGTYAQAYHLEDRPSTLTEAVKNWKKRWPRLLPLPHPSPRNRAWFKNNPWFEEEVVPALRRRVARLRRGVSLGIALAAASILGACGPEGAPHRVIPLPASAEFTVSDTFHLSPETRIVYDAGDAEAERIGGFLATLIGNSAETVPSLVAASGDRPDGSIHLTRRGANTALGAEGYELTITPQGATLRAAESAGLFYGVQTLRQLLSPVVEYTAAYYRPLHLPALEVADTPRFGWRGAMLDVARHFLEPAEVKRFIDLMALYKLNRLHLHLSDDQGWRVEIPGWPNLTAHGGSTEVGGGPGGYYTTAEYADIVRYAEERFITVVPEFDVPGHTNAALASYPELNCDGVAPDLYIGTNVGFSSLCTEKDITYDFLEDVVREISALTPGPFFHIGGDEVQRLSPEQYVEFIHRVQGIVQSHGKRMVGWDEVAEADLAEGSIVQLWRPLWSDDGSVELDSAAAAHTNQLKEGVARASVAGVGFILSPADRLYLDMKYDRGTVLGLSWAGLSNTRTSYDWRVVDMFGDIPEETILGVEATLWSETLGTVDDFEYMAFPRLAGVAEIGWSPEALRDWDEYRIRLGAHSVRWKAMGVNFRRSPLVPWAEEPY